MHVLVNGEYLIRITEFLYCRMEKFRCVHGIAKQNAKFLHCMPTKVNAKIHTVKFFLFLGKNTLKHVANLKVNYLRERAVKNGHLKEGEDLWMDYSDDTYMVYDLTGGGHSHVESEFVFPNNKPVSKSVRKRLETAMATEF